MDKKKYLVVIGGATATGKTAVAISLARYFQTEIISADSRQFYREMNIGTAKPSTEELASAVHQFVDSLSLSQDYSAGQYEKDALIAISKLHETKQVVVMAGGSGLFINAVCSGLNEFPEVPHEIKEELTKNYEKNGISVLQEELRLLDPVYFERVDTNNPHRLIRALSICRASGKPFSDFQGKEKAVRPFTPIYVLLELDRKLLYEKIEKRVDEMMEKGLLNEVEGLLPYKNLNALQTVGYRELFSFLDGDIRFEQAVELIKQNSRRYAKRQVTWFRKDAHWKTFHPASIDSIIDWVNSQMVF